MAIYQFKCTECDFIFEKDMPMARASSTHYGACPNCAELHPPRYYGEVNFILKGDGWPSKNIRGGNSAIADNKFEADQIKRKQTGQKTFDKEVPMSDKEFKKRKKNLEDWIDQGET